jgi:hypothetical protein
VSTATATRTTRPGRCALRGPITASERRVLRRTRCRASVQVRTGEGWVRVGGSRFLQTDPVPGGSANLYDYAGQDPVNVFDLDGRQWRADVEGCGAGPDIGEGLSAADRDAGWGQNTPPRGSSRSRWSPPRFSSTRRKDVGYTSEWAKSQHQAFGKADFQWRHGGGRATFRGTHGGPRGPHVHVEFKDRGGKIYHVHHIYYPRGL